MYLVADYKEAILNDVSAKVSTNRPALPGNIFYTADSDSVIVKGLISMLIRVLSCHSPGEIINAKLDFIREIGMMTHLAQTRSNGLLAMLKQMKNYAMAYKIKSGVTNQ